MEAQYERFDSGTIGPVDASRVPRFAGIATFARLPRLEEVPRADIAVVGIRGPLFNRRDLRDDQRLGFAIISANEIEEEGIASAISRMHARVGNRPVYLSVDIDVLDPAHAPGTGTPEAGGLSSRELLRLLREFSKLNLIGADLVEVAPPYDHAQLTGIAAAHVIFEIISAMAVTIVK
ncbi:arginase family protein [Gulosibacter chungangensis]|uniref:Agmatinase n=1 Tax=Gulosibacter chungangensis TaxID=979746 RepID=A0A7J5B972_9MICO|nr:arginase family protein [Gulosibacter chungangensis]KAB1641939.1 hypothetical protein F8O05_11515 [Gulosibacter chungangensis]